MSGTKISVLNPVASVIDTDDFALRRAGSNGRAAALKLFEYMASKGFLVGNPSGVYVENQSNNDKWQLDQRAAQLFFGGGDDVVPDVEKNDRFVLQVNAGGAVLRPPTNVPNTNTGMFYFQIHAFSATDADLTFGAGTVELPGSKPYDNSTDMNIIECWTTVGGTTYYRVDNALLAPGQSLLVEGVITSAQILNSFTSPVELIPAPGAGKIIWIDSIGFFRTAGTVYATNTNARFRHLGDGGGVPLLLNATTGLMNTSVTISSFANTINKPFVFTTLTDDPETGTFDIFYSIKYRIIDDPFA